MVFMMFVGSGASAIWDFNESVGVAVALIGTRVLFSLGKAWEETHPATDA